MLSSSVVVKIQGADHRANSAASYAAARLRQALRKLKIRLRWRQIINIDNLSHQPSRPSLIAAKSTRKRLLCRFGGLVLLILWGNGALTSGSDVIAFSAASEPARAAVHPELAIKLTADFRTAFSDKPLRDALESIAKSRQINYWLDREVDPTSLVTSGGDAQTAFQAIESLALAAGVKATVVDNVVLIGRSEWLDRTAAVALSLPSSSTVSQISWPALTTPTEAARACCDHEPPALPHDLWPAVSWSQMNASLAHLLIAAQFDRMPSTSASTGYVPLKPPTKIAAFYPTGKHATALRSAALRADARCVIKEAGSQLLLTGSITAHLAAIRAWLGDTASPAKVDIDQIKFTLRLENTAAMKVFRQLAATAGRQLVIHPDTVAGLERLVSLTANDQSLRELSANLADSANVSIVWTDAALTINPRN